MKLMLKGYQGAFPDKSFCKLRRRRKCENGQSAVTLPCLPVSFQHITCAQVGNKYGLTSALIGQKSESEPSSNLCGDVSIFIPDLGIILPVYYRRYKLASSVNLYRFTYLRRFPQMRNLRKLLVGEAFPIPFDRHLRCRLRPHCIDGQSLGAVRYCVLGYRHGRIQRAGTGAPYPQPEP